MGLLAADLQRYRERHLKTSSDRPAVRFTEPNGLESLESALQRYAGANLAAEKTASEKISEEDHKTLWSLHREVEKGYRWAVKQGNRPEANAILDKYAGWTWLKGAPKEPGDLHPFPAPDGK